VFEQKASLENLSSTGALLAVSHPVARGARVELAVRIPTKKERWMRFEGEVVRVQPDVEDLAIAVRFDSARPLFAWG
jgi:hypothetical protein